MTLLRRLAELDRRLLGTPETPRETRPGSRAANAVLAGAMVLLTAYVGAYAVVDGRLPRWPMAAFAMLLAASMASVWADIRR